MSTHCLILLQVSVEDLSSPEESWPVGECVSGWEYEVEDYHKSITVEFDWVCDQAWIPALSQTVFFFGAIPGMLFFGWFSDTFGRLPTIMFSNILALVTGIATPFVTGHFSFLALRLAMGLAFNTFYTDVSSKNSSSRLVHLYKNDISLKIS